MSLSDCVKCYDTPCTCGYGYRRYDKESRIKLASVILGVNVEDILMSDLIIPKDHPMKDEK